MSECLYDVRIELRKPNSTMVLVNLYSVHLRDKRARLSMLSVSDE